MASSKPMMPKSKKGEYVFGTPFLKEKVPGKYWLDLEYKCFFPAEICKWLFPFFFAGVGFYCQSVGLHWATYQYIHKYAAAPEEYRTLYDSIERGEPEKINMATIDKIAGFIPMLFMVLTAYAAFPLSCSKLCCRKLRNSDKHPRHDFLMRQNVLRIWTKVMTCAMFLFMWKGILGAITVVPDSSGWNVCKNRLKQEGMEWMRQDHSFYDMLSIDAIWVSEHHTPLRYCADMMFSGHTFVVTLFALGTYEMMRAFRFENLFSGKYATAARKVVLKISVLTFYACFVIVEQVLEIKVVERSHFHYSMDVFMAIILTFLIYTNGVIAVFAKHWTTWGLLILNKKEEGAPFEKTNMGVWQNVCEWLAENTSENNEVDWREAWEGDAETGYSTDPKEKEWALLNSRGDIFIPPCCFPFCFYAGREHVYSDEGVMAIVEQCGSKLAEQSRTNEAAWAIARGQYELAEQSIRQKHDFQKRVGHIRKYLENTMMLDEGVSLDDWKTVTKNSPVKTVVGSFHN